jgi:dTDP-4-amino-4,6-dideoxygalactose transaminase
VSALKARGLGAASPYPSSLGEVTALAPFVEPRHERLRGAREAAARLLTLPTHPFVSASDVARIADVIAGPRALADLAPRVMVSRP